MFQKASPTWLPACEIMRSHWFWTGRRTADLAGLQISNCEVRYWKKVIISRRLYLNIDDFSWMWHDYSIRRKGIEEEYGSVNRQSFGFNRLHSAILAIASSSSRRGVLHLLIWRSGLIMILNCVSEFVNDELEDQWKSLHKVYSPFYWPRGGLVIIILVVGVAVK